MVQQPPVELVKQASTASILWGIFLIALGAFAVIAPMFAAIAINAIVAWLLLFAGVIHIILAFSAHGAGSFLWKLLLGLAYLVWGIYLLLHPSSVSPYSHCCSPRSSSLKACWTSFSTCKRGPSMARAGSSLTASSLSSSVA
jgi:uncharacterized membrane protein HdeD (DUF308 family)